MGGNTNIGYLFNQYFAIEGGLTYLRNNGYNGWNQNPYYIGNIAVKGILPLNNIFDLFGKAGLSYGRSDIKFKT